MRSEIAPQQIAFGIGFAETFIMVQRPERDLPVD
jgi:hypothetical protein